MPKLSLIVHNVRSTHNVGSMLRTADGLGVDHVYLTGYTPYPLHPRDTRLPHQAKKINDAIHKTALGAEVSVSWSQHANIELLIEDLRRQHITVLALEQADTSVELQTYISNTPPMNTAILVGNEVTGIDRDLLNLVDTVVEIEMRGQKESFNVSVAAAVVMYQFSVRFTL